MMAGKISPGGIPNFASTWPSTGILNVDTLLVGLGVANRLLGLVNLVVAVDLLSVPKGIRCATLI